jgi:hypothetical protein
MAFYSPPNAKCQRQDNGVNVPGERVMISDFGVDICARISKAEGNSSPDIEAPSRRSSGANSHISWEDTVHTFNVPPDPSRFAFLTGLQDRLLGFDCTPVPAATCDQVCRFVSFYRRATIRLPVKE